jgi:hypothetical protein
VSPLSSRQETTYLPEKAAVWLGILKMGEWARSQVPKVETSNWTNRPPGKPVHFEISTYLHFWNLRSPLVHFRTPPPSEEGVGFSGGENPSSSPSGHLLPLGALHKKPQGEPQRPPKVRRAARSRRSRDRARGGSKAASPQGLLGNPPARPYRAALPSWLRRAIARSRFPFFVQSPRWEKGGQSNFGFLVQSPNVMVAMPQNGF